MTISLGHRSVADCQRSISAAEFTEWQAYFKIRPFGPWLAEFLAAQIQTTDVNKRRQKDDPPVKLSDFLPRWIPEPITEPDQDAIAESVKRVFGALCQNK